MKKAYIWEYPIKFWELHKDIIEKQLKTDWILGLLPIFTEKKDAEKNWWKYITVEFTGKL